MADDGTWSGKESVCRWFYLNMEWVRGSTRVDDKERRILLNRFYCRGMIYSITSKTAVIVVVVLEKHEMIIAKYPFHNNL